MSLGEKRIIQSWEKQYGYPPMFGRKKLLLLIWPLLVEQLLNVFVGMVDVLMVATLGEAAVSGVALVDAVNNLIIQVLFAVTSGGTVVCAQFVGAKDEKSASRAGGQIFLLTISAMLLIMGVFLAGKTVLLGRMFGRVEADVMRNSSTYLSLTALSFPFLAAYNSGASIFRANGNTRIPMLVSLLINGINIGGNALCIFVLGMGVEGVAIPTVIARAVAAVLVVWLLQTGNNQVKLRSSADLRPDGRIIRRILSIGIPNGIESGLFQTGKVLLQSLVSTLGTASIAAFAVGSNLVTYMYLPGNALGAAMITIVGQCYGAGEREQARFYARKLVVMNYALLAVICTVMALCRAPLVGMYHLSAEADVMAQGLVLIHALAMTIWPVAFLLPYYLRATGKAAFTMLVAISSMWIFRIGLAYVFIRAFHFNVLGIWYAMFADWFFRFVVFAMKFHASDKE